MGHVVDGEEVADRGRQARAPAGRLHRVPDHAEEGDAAARLAEHEVADVVAAGPGDAVGDEVVLDDRLAVARVAGAARVARRRARARRSGAAVLGVGIEVEGVVAVDQHELDREIVVVELVDPVHQRHLGRGDVLGAEVGGVRRVADQGQPVRALDDRVTRVQGGGQDGARPVGQDRRLLEHALVDVGQIAAPVGDVGALVAPVVRVHVPGAARRPHRRVEAERGDVEADRGGRVRDAAPGVRADLGVPGGEARLHDRRLDDPEALDARGAGDAHDRLLAAGALERRVRHEAAQCRAVERVGAEPRRASLDRGARGQVLRQPLPQPIALRRAAGGLRERGRRDRRCGDEGGEEEAYGAGHRGNVRQRRTTNGRFMENRPFDAGDVPPPGGAPAAAGGVTSAGGCG